MLRFVLFIVLCLATAGCDSNDDRRPLRAAVLPDQAPEQLHQNYQPLLDYLSVKTGRTVELIIPSDYQNMVDIFAAGDVDIAFFGGLTFVQAEKRAGAIPLVSRDIDARFTSYFIARTSSPGTSIADFGGSRLGFGSRQSTSGHLMPRYFMQSLGIDPETFFASVEFTGAHDRTAVMVRDGVLDIGAVNAQIVRDMVASEALSMTDIRIVWETPPYIDYVWAAHPGLEAETRHAVVGALIELSASDPRHKEILAKFGANIFLPARVGDFDSLRALAADLGFL